MSAVKYSSIELVKAIHTAPRGLSTLLSVTDAGHGGIVKSITRDGDVVSIEASDGTAFDIPWSRCERAKLLEAKKK